MPPHPSPHDAVRPGGPDDDDIDDRARALLGIETWRPGQRESISAALAGHDVLAVMPSASGKSAIYQVVAALTDGPAVVISPLLALQRDQLAHLEDAGAARAVAVSSASTAGERAEALEQLAAGAVDIVFLAPEQLARADTLEALRAAGVGLVVVDEAHCVTAWGHDFRPDYLRIGALIDDLGRPRVVALTATAAPPVQDEIVRRLHLRDERVIVAGFDRPELRLAVETFVDATEKDEAIVARAVELDGDARSGIVYTATRARAEDLAERLQRQGVRSAAYHAGLARGTRTALQDEFMAGGLDVVVATNAFGMGIDKPDVRFVLHADIPESLDAYYQEIGRAGRDGQPAEAVLFHRTEDLGLRRFLGGGAGVDEEDLARVAELVVEVDGPVTPDELQEQTALGPHQAARVANLLGASPAVSMDVDGTLQAAGTPAAVRRAARDAAATEDDRRERERSRLEMMRTYAEARSCRRALLLSYFGEAAPDRCGRCDNCESGRAARAAAVDPGGRAGRFRPQAPVVHREWGRGTVLRVEGDTLTVLFDDVGYKQLSVELVEANGLLEEA